MTQTLGSDSRLYTIYLTFVWDMNGKPMFKTVQHTVAWSEEPPVQEFEDVVLSGVISIRDTSNVVHIYQTNNLHLLEYGVANAD